MRGVGKQKAERMLAALLVEEDAPVSGTFGDLAERWYELRSPADWSPKTAKETRWMLDHYLAPLMKTPLTRPTPVKLDAFYSSLRARGGKGGATLSAASVRRIHTVVHSALNQGIRWGLLSGNPAQRASPGQVDDRDIDPPAPEDLLRLFRRRRAGEPGPCGVPRARCRHRRPAIGAVRAALVGHRSGSHDDRQRDRRGFTRRGKRTPLYRAHLAGRLGAG